MGLAGKAFQKKQLWTAALTGHWTKELQVSWGKTGLQVKLVDHKA